jgi:hypothetical protein
MVFALLLSPRSKNMSRKQRGPVSFAQQRGSDEDEVFLRVDLKGIRERRRQDQAGSSVKSSSSKSNAPPLQQQRQDRNAPPLQQQRQDRNISASDSSSHVSARSNRSARSSSSRSYRFEKMPDDASVSAYSISSKPKTGEEAAIKRLITEDLWNDNAETVERGLKKLSGILGMKKTSPNAARNQDIIFRAGGHLAIVQAMRKHKSSEEVQGEGCRALGIVAEEIMDSGNENAIAIVGGIDAILAAMRTFRNDEQIQDFGCGALQNLTGLGENAQILVEQEGLSVVLMSMRSFPKSTLVQESACWTIVNLCLQKENKAKIEKSRCFSTVASAIDNHPRCEQVKIAAHEALQHLLKLLPVGPK